jgi:hypothetical protein
VKTSKRLLYSTFLLFLFSSCYGPRNIFSSGPYISPVKLEKQESAIEVFHSTNTKKSDKNDTTKGNKNNGYTLSFIHRFNANNQFNYYVGIENEKLSLYDTTHFIYSNTGFDYSSISTKRFTTGIGFSQFIDKSYRYFLIATSISGMIGYQHSQIFDIGQIKQNAYIRNFDINNLFFIIQSSALIDVCKSFKIGIMNRFTFSHYFNMKTNYTSNELDSTGLNKENKTQLYASLIGLHLEFKPFKKMPVSIIGQWYNDWSFWNHFMVGYELNRTYIRGSGASIGLKYEHRSYKSPF